MCVKKNTKLFFFFNTDKFFFLKHSVVDINIIAMHYDEKYWNKPTEYNPDRWLDQVDKQPRHAFAYAPFGAGARVCIGNNFSLLEQKLFLCNLLQKFKVELPYEGYEIPTEFKGVFAPSKDFYLHFKPRQ